MDNSMLLLPGLSPEQEIADCRKAIELDPKDALAYVNRRHAYRLKGDYDRAISDCHKAIELDPNFALACTNLGNVYKINAAEISTPDWTPRPSRPLSVMCHLTRRTETRYRCRDKARKGAQR